MKKYWMLNEDTEPVEVLAKSVGNGFYYIPDHKITVSEDTLFNSQVDCIVQNLKYYYQQHEFVTQQISNFESESFNSHKETKIPYLRIVR